MMGRRTSFQYFCAINSDMPCTVAEIGVDKGYNSVEMLLGNPDLTLYAVDHYDNESVDGCGKELFSRQRIEEHKEHARKVLDVFGNRVHRILKPSLEAVKDFPNEFFDYIYIDGDHEYNAIKKDLKEWYPKLKKYGVFAGHDFAGGCHDVVMAVIEFYNELGVKFQTGYEGDFWHVKE